MMKKLLILLVTAICIMSFTAEKAHDFYVSITEINVVNDTAQISLRIFTDDLEFVLKKENNQAYYLAKASDFDKNQHAISRYLENHFTIGSASENQDIQWFGHEIEEDVVWIYGQAPISTNSSLLVISNQVLMDYYDDQQNMVHLKRPDGFESEICSRRRSTVRFSLGQ